MARIVVHASGTLGDHLPMVALAQGLRGRGHDVEVIANEALRDFADQLGLPVVSLEEGPRGPEQARRNAWSWNHWQHPPNPAAPHPRAPPLRFEDLAQRARDLAARAADADLLISTAIRPLGALAHLVAQTPWLTVSLNPGSFVSPPAQERPAFFRAARATSYRDQLLLHWMHEALGHRGPRPSFRRGMMWAPQVILACSRHFFAPDLDQLQPFARVEQTGSWRYRDPRRDAWQPSAELAAFCERRPIVSSLSSQPLEDRRAILDTHVRAARRLGAPLLVQRGWAGFEPEDLEPSHASNEILFCDFVPHDWLFARARCAIVHGGIGTLVAAIEQACPVLVTPFGNDQFFNARRVKNLGVGAWAHPFDSRGEQIATQLFEQVLTPQTAQRCRALGRRLLEEDGIAQACRLIERSIERGGALARSRLWNGYWPLSSSVPSVMPEHALPEVHTAECEGTKSTIPTIIHQMVPPTDAHGLSVQWQESWQAQHPQWQHRRWSNESLVALIDTHYPWFANAFARLPPSQRSRIGACFVVHRHGGVFVDLDCEAMRSLEPLLLGRDAVFSCEPPAHLQVERGPTSLRICPSIFAASPGHPLWRSVFEALHSAFDNAPDPYTVDFAALLSGRIVAYRCIPGAPTVTVLANELLCPLSGFEDPTTMPPELIASVREGAYAIGHFWPSRWRETLIDPRPGVRVLRHGKLVPGAAGCDREVFLEHARAAGSPLVSCLMVTRGRFAAARRAIDCFVRQSYPHKELVIVDDDPNSEIHAWLREHPHPQIRCVPVEPGRRPLGALRNLSVREAKGEYVAQWDDDDISAPNRLALQLGAIAMHRASACLLAREMLWWPGRALAKSGERLWEGSAVVARRALSPFAEVRRGEDTPVIERVTREHDVVIVDAPDLYAYVFHGANTFDEAHHRALLDRASVVYDGQWLAPMVERYERALGVPLELPQRRRFEPSTTRSLPDPSRVVVLTVVDASHPLTDRYFENLATLDYPKDALALGLMRLGEHAPSRALLDRWLPRLREQYANVTVAELDSGALGLSGVDRDVAEASARAQAKNVLLHRALNDASHVLWLDPDVAAYPPNLLRQLLLVRKAIVVPNRCSTDPSVKGDPRTYRCDPESGQREYMPALRNEVAVVLDAASAAIMLVDAQVHRRGLVFPAAGEGLEAAARPMGLVMWGLPNVQVY